MRKIPLEDFFRNAESSSYQLSPDGRHIAWLAPWRDRMNVFVKPCGQGSDLSGAMPRRENALPERENVFVKPCGQGSDLSGAMPRRENAFPEDCDAPLRLTDETERSVAGYMWADNDRILYMKDTGGDENYQLYGVRADGTDRRAYTAFPGVRTTLIDDLEEQDGFVMIGLNRRNPEVFDPYRLNLETGELTLLAENPGNWQGWMTDHEGKLRAVTAIVDGVNTQILYRETEEQDFRPVLTTNFKETVSFMEFAADGKTVYAATNLGRDKTALVLMAPATCQELEVLYADERYDISSITYSRLRRKLLAVYCTGHKEPVRHYFDEEQRLFRERLQAHFPGRRIGVADCDKAEQHYLVYVGGDRTRGSYYYYDVLADRVAHIADLAPWIREEEMAEMHAVTYTTRDGLRIEAYLSLPDGLTPATAKSLPVVVNPHGGPWARDYWGYSPEVQFLCNRGYAVLQMNFRGSTGYGRAFLEASYKQWGLKMQDDITDGVRWLVAEGIADPARVAIYGGSYGGYAALAGVAFTPELYCCAVDYVGVANLFTFMNTIPPYWRPLLEMMHEQVGDPEKDAEQLRETSPVFHADRVTAPLFIAQGANDPRVNKDESDQMVAALRSRGVEVEYVVKENEGHGFANQENRFDFYRAMESFLEKHLGTGGK